MNASARYAEHSGRIELLDHAYARVLELCPPDFTDAQSARLVSYAEECAAQGRDVDEAIRLAIDMMTAGLDPFGAS